MFGDRLRDRRGPAVLHRRVPPRRPRRAAALRRRRATARSTSEQWNVAPYTEADLQRQVDQLADVLRRRTARSCQQRPRATTSPASTSTSPRRGSTRRRCRPSTPRSASRRARRLEARPTWSRPPRGRRDLRQGRRRRARARRWCSQAAQKRFGEARGKRVWHDFRSAEDPEAPTTVHGKRFPYEVPPKHAARAASRCPDPGSVTDCAGARRPPGRRRAPARARGAARRRCWRSRRLSNALLVSARESAPGTRWRCSGRRPRYFAPQILMEQDVHAPRRDRRPRRSPSSAPTSTSSSAAAATTPGARPRRARTSPTRSRCRCASERRSPRHSTPTATGAVPADRDARRARTRWPPTLADSTPAGTRDAARRAHEARARDRRAATIKGKPVIYTRLRTTYFHEIDSAAGFTDFNDPAKVHDAASFQQAASQIGYTFNWFYVDAERSRTSTRASTRCARGATDPNFPVARAASSGAAGTRTPGPRAITPLRAHPQAIDQRYLTSWNNKQARGYRAADGNGVRADLPLEDARRPREGRRSRASARSTLPELVTAMEDARHRRPARRRGAAAGRCRCIGQARATPRCAPRSPSCAPGARAGGAPHRPRPRRRLRARRGDPDHGRVVAAAGAARSSSRCSARPRSRRLAGHATSSTTTRTTTASTSAPPARTAGTATCSRTCARVLGRKVRGRYSRVYCGGGSLKALPARAARARCRRRSTVPASRSSTATTGLQGAGRPATSRASTRSASGPLGGATQPLIHWINRPTLPAGRTRSSAAGRSLSRPGAAGDAACRSDLTCLARDRIRHVHGAPRRARRAPTPSACSRSSSTRASGSSSALEVRLGRARGRAARLAGAARRRAAVAAAAAAADRARRRDATSSAGPAERELHVLAPRLLAQRASNVEGSLEMLMLAPSALLARRALARRHPGLPPPLGPRPASRAGCAGRGSSRARAQWLSGQTRHVRPAVARRLREGARAGVPAQPRATRRCSAAPCSTCWRARRASGLRRARRGPHRDGADAALDDAFDGRGVRHTEAAWRSHLRAAGRCGRRAAAHLAPPQPANPTPAAPSRSSAPPPIRPQPSRLEERDLTPALMSASTSREPSAFITTTE